MRFWKQFVLSDLFIYLFGIDSDDKRIQRQILLKILFLFSLSLVTKTTAGAVADYFKQHRAVFLGGLVFMGTSLTALYWAPDIPTADPNLPTTATSFSSSPAQVLNATTDGGHDRNLSSVPRSPSGSPVQGDHYDLGNSTANLSTPLPSLGTLPHTQSGKLYKVT